MMECEQIDDIIIRARNDAELPDEARQHFAACPRCRSLYNWFGRGAAPELSPALRDRITRSLPASLAPAKMLPASPIVVLRLLILFAAILALWLFSMGTGGVARMTAAHLLVLSTVLPAGAALFAFALSGQMRPGSRQYARPAAALGVAAFAAMALLFPWDFSSASVAQGWPCLSGGLAIAVSGAALFGLVVRRGAPVSSSTLGATLGGTAGWLGLTVLQYKRPHQEAPHLLIWHGGVLLVASAVGLAIAALRTFTAARPR